MSTITTNENREGEARLERVLNVPQTRFYVASGCLPMPLPSPNCVLDYGGNGRVFDTEREALDYAITQKKEALEMAQQAYDELVNRRDKLETQEVSREF